MSDDETPDEQAAKAATPPPPGPADHGGHGGMATREKAPELAEGDESRD
jgi:hypothetical protein